MRRIALRAGVLGLGSALALTSAWVLAQDDPESLLPPGFDRPAPKTRTPAPAPAPAGEPAAGNRETAATPAAPAQQGVAGVSAGPAAPLAASAAPAPVKLPPVEVLEKMSPEELDALLGIKPKYDIPQAARRSMEQVGILAEDEGGLPALSLAGQDVGLVRAAIAGNQGAMVSRWGHILVRRALASRLDAPAAMNPADFAALRAGLLLRMGEGAAARALVQDVDTGNFTPDLTQAALDAYIFTADLTGMCPAVTLQGAARKDPQWQVISSICTVFKGDTTVGTAQLDRQLYYGVMPRIDMLLAQKYAGAVGKARRAVKIDWADVQEMTPWRYALTIGVGLQPPAGLMSNAGPRYDYMAATAPMLGLEARAAAADKAAGAGILSSAAMVDLYSQIYADQDNVEDEWSTRGTLLRDAYVGSDARARLTAMRQLWDGAADPGARFARQVLTAYAAARLPAGKDLSGDAGDIIASMLSAGLDRNALRWANLAKSGSPGWALLIVASPGINGQIDASALEKFQEGDRSESARKSAFLLAGLAGLGRVSPQTAGDFAATLGIDLNRQTRWTRLIDRSAQVDNAALVALLAGLGMQGDGWDKMTPVHLFHIVSSLRRVGLGAEARMIAAEAVARG
jgi:hypothetical protein